MSAGRCDACDFDYSTVDPADVPGRLAPVIEAFRVGLRDHDARVLRIRPRPQVWSALEYACHVRDVLLVQRDRLYRVLVEEIPDCIRMHREERAILDRYNRQEPGRVARQLGFAADLAGEAFAGVDRSAWSRRLINNWPNPHLLEVRGLAAHTVHEAAHHLADFCLAFSTAIG